MDMATTPSISFVARDFDTNLQQLKELISERAPESWNSFFEGDLGKMLIDLIAYDHAALCFTMDTQAKESFLDTLRLKESLSHFTNLTGYNIRRGVASSIECYAQILNAAPQDGITIAAGTKITDIYGKPWEVTKNATIREGKYNPSLIVQSYGDVKTSRYVNGVLSEIAAKIKLTVGESTAVLTDGDGARLTSDNGFGSLVGQGHILMLEGVDVTRSEFAITDVGRFSYDTYDRSVLYLDRPWDGASDYIGKWSIDNRNIQLTQGETFHETFTVPSDNLLNYTIPTTFYPVISAKTEDYIVSGYSGLDLSNPEGGVSVIVNGIPWTETSSLLFLGSNANSFEISFNHQDQAILRFGDGVFGRALPPNAVVEIIYRVGGGAEGNIPQNSFDSSLQTSNNNQTVTVFITNPYTVGRGGQSTETLEESKRHITQHVRTNDRAVTIEDYSYLASNFVSASGRIKLAKAVLHTNTVPREQNIVWIYTWVEGRSGQLERPTLALKAALKSYLDLRRMICDEVVIIDGIVNNVPLRFFYKYDVSITPDVISEKISSSLNAKLISLSPGETLRISQLYEAIESVDEVIYALFDVPSSDVPVTVGQMEMLVNSLQPPDKTRLIEGVAAGTGSVVVSDPSIFYAGGLISIFQQGKRATTARISSVGGSVVTFTNEFTTLTSYTTDAEVINSDYYPISWQYDLPVDIYIDFSTTSSMASTRVAATLAKRVKDYITLSLLPAMSLQKSKIESIVSSTSGVATFSVHLGSKDSLTERISSAQRERITLKSVVINGKIL